LFLRRRERAINERAKLIQRMVMLIVHSLQTKSYDEFVDSFSNFGSEPSPLERLERRLFFRMRMSPSCWYDAWAEYPADGSPFFHIGGGGDDWGVLISGDAIADRSIGVDFYVRTKAQAGRDAHAMMHALRELPGWSHTNGIELKVSRLTRAAGSGAEQQSNPLVYEDDPRGGSMGREIHLGRDIHRKNVERLERALKAAADEGKQKLKLIEEKRAKLNNGPLGDSLAAIHASVSASNPLRPRV
jgi:hypothetical protein